MLIVIMVGFLMEMEGGGGGAVCWVGEGDGAPRSWGGAGDGGKKGGEEMVERWRVGD